MINIRPFSQTRQQKKSRTSKLFDTSFNNFKNYIDKSIERKTFNSTTKNFFKSDNHSSRPQIQIEKLNFNNTQKSACYFLPPKSLGSKQRIYMSSTTRGFSNTNMTNNSRQNINLQKNKQFQNSYSSQTPTNNQTSRQRVFQQGFIDQKQLKIKVENTAMSRFKELFKKQTNVKSKRIQEQQSKKLMTLLQSTYRKNLQKTQQMTQCNNKKWFNENTNDFIDKKQNYTEQINHSKKSDNILMKKNQEMAHNIHNQNQKTQNREPQNQRIKDQKKKTIQFKNEIRQKVNQSQNVYDNIKIQQNYFQKKTQENKINSTIKEDKNVKVQETNKLSLNQSKNVLKTQKQINRQAPKQAKQSEQNHKISTKQQQIQKEHAKQQMRNNSIQMSQKSQKQQKIKQKVQQSKKQQTDIKRQVEKQASNSNTIKTLNQQNLFKKNSFEPQLLKDLPEIKVIQTNKQLANKTQKNLVSQKIPAGKNNSKNVLKNSKEIKTSKQFKPASVPNRYQNTNQDEQELQQIVIQKGVKQVQQKIKKSSQVQDIKLTQSKQMAKYAKAEKQKKYDPARQSLTSLSQSLKNQTHTTPLKQKQNKTSIYKKDNEKSPIKIAKMVNDEEDRYYPQIQSRQQFKQSFDDDDQQNDAVQQLFYLIALVQNLGGYNNNSKQFYSNADSSMVQIVMNHKLAAYYISQQFYYYQNQFLNHLLKKQKGNFYSLSQQQLYQALQDDEVKQAIQQLSDSYNMTPKLLKHTYQKCKLYLGKEDKIFKQNSKQNYHQKCKKYLKQQFNQLYKMYQKTQSKTLSARLCYIIQIYNILMSLNGQELKQFEQLQQIGEQNYSKHLNKYKNLIIE